MRRQVLAAGLALAFLATGCSTIKQTIDPAATQLERFKGLGATREYAAIAGEALRCGEAGEVCRQLHLIKGDACFELARGDDAAVAHYDCAIAELTAGLDGGAERTLAFGPSRPFAEKLLEALRARRDLSASTSESKVYTARLIREARAFRAAYPEDPAGHYFETSGLYALVLDEIAKAGGHTATCSELEALLDRLGPGDAANGRYTINFERLRQDIQGTRRAECEA
jgi:hypothetical protein